MCYGRALLLGIALASAVAAELAYDPVDTTATAQLGVPDAAADAGSIRPPAQVALVVAPPAAPVCVAVAVAAAVPAPPVTPAPIPLVVAPKTSPPALRA